MLIIAVVGFSGSLAGLLLCERRPSLLVACKVSSLIIQALMILSFRLLLRGLLCALPLNPSGIRGVDSDP